VRLNTSQLSLNNRYTVLSRAMDNTSCCDLNNEEGLREVTVKICLERVDTQCYDLKTLGLVNEQIFVYGYTRELDRELCTGLSTLYTKLHGL